MGDLNQKSDPFHTEDDNNPMIYRDISAMTLTFNSGSISTLASGLKLATRFNIIKTEFSIISA